LPVLASKREAASESVLSCQHSLATALLFQKQFGEAERLYREILEIRCRKPGQDCDRARSALAYLLKQADRHADAEPVLADLLAALQGRSDDMAAETATTLTELAEVRFQLGKAQEAEADLRQALMIALRPELPANDRLATVCRSLALLLSARQRFPEAIAPQKRAIAVTQQIGGEQHDDLPRLRAELGVLLNNSGRYAEAEAEFHLAVPRLEEALGEANWYFQWYLHSQAVTLKILGKYAESEQAVARVLALRIKSLGDSDRLVAISRGLLAEDLSAQSRNDEAEPHAREALRIHVDAASADSVEAREAALTLTEILAASGQRDEALRRARRAIEFERAAAPVVPHRLGRSLALMARLLVDTGDGAAAEPLARECLALATEHAAGSLGHLESQGLLGAALACLGRHAEAEPLLRECCEKHRSPPGKPTLHRWLLDRLIDCYEALEQADDAGRWRQIRDRWAKGAVR
jgi:tetratricopeptide (TPR) repeat protein